MALNEMQKNSSLMENLKQLKKTYQSVASETSSVCNDVQGLIPISDIRNGLIITTDGRVVSMVEIIPLNFFEMPGDKQDICTDAFGNAFKQLPKNGQFKVLNVKTNLEAFENRVRNATKNEHNKPLNVLVDNYFAFMKLRRQGVSISKRFFHIFEYEGDDRGNKTVEFEDIIANMRQKQRDTIIALSSMGNVVIDMQNDSIAIAEVLYQYFNPQSSQEESLNKRMAKLNETSRWFGQSPCLKDCIAPRGIKFCKWNYLVMDGIYHTYFAITDSGYPNEAPSAWLMHIINNLNDCDLDIFYRMNDSSVSDFFIERTDVISRGVALTHHSSEIDKQQQLYDTSSNARYIKKAKDNGEDLYDVCVIATLRAKSYKEMTSMVESFLKTMNRTGISMINCFAKTDMYFFMTMPLMNVNGFIFNANKHNMTNSSLASLYHFATYEMFDTNGYWFGTAANGTMFGVDNYSKRYANPHISILGSTGAGKTCTELSITTRMRLSGMRTMYVLPLKGHEYKHAIESMNGEFIPLYPGSGKCINICEIRPVAGLGTVHINDSELQSLLNERSSLLDEKVSSLITWFRLLMNDGETLTTSENGRLNILFTAVYNSYGITEDNMSIFKNNNPRCGLKRMPIIQDLYDAIIEDGSLHRLENVLEPWIFGSCKTMNGQTNVSLDNKCIAFDVNEDKTTQEFLAAYMYIAFDICYQIAQADLDERCCITLDETWQFLKVPACSDYIFKMIKILRAYSTTIITASQNITDYMRTENGTAILSLPAIKIVLKVDTDDELSLISRVVRLSNKNKEEILSLEPGSGFFCANNDRIKVHFDLSQMQLWIYEPKPKKKQEIYERMIANGLP